jgi:hypothetical protein
MHGRIGVLSNPNSGKNRRRFGDAGQGRCAELREAVGQWGLVRQTSSLDEVAAVLEEFFDAGCDTWVCDGGDGTLHHMLSVGWQIARRRGETQLPLIVPANGGSIDFVAHKAGIRGGAVDILRALADIRRGAPDPGTVSLDTFRMQGTFADGSARVFDRVGFATAIGGVAQRFFGKLYESKPVDGRSIARVLASSVAGAAVASGPRALERFYPDVAREYADAIFAPTRARVSVDGETLDYDSFASLQIGAIDINLGGVVRTFRHAARAGVLHAQAISMSPLAVAANLPNIVLGTPIWGRNVFDGPARSLRVDAFPDAPLDPVIDGELFFGLSSLDVERGPQLRVPSVCRAA